MKLSKWTGFLVVAVVCAMAAIVANPVSAAKPDGGGKEINPRI